MTRVTGRVLPLELKHSGKAPARREPPGAALAAESLRQ